MSAADAVKSELSSQVRERELTARNNSITLVFIGFSVVALCRAKPRILNFTISVLYCLVDMAK